MKTRKDSTGDIWTQESGRMVISSRGPGVGGFVFGGGLLAFGSYFLYKNLILNIGEMARSFAEFAKAGAIGDICSALFVLLFVLFFGACLAVPGWLLVFQRRRVVIDVGRGELDEMKDLLIFRRARTHRLADFAEIVVEKDNASGNSGSYMREVRLLPRTAGTHVRVGIMDSQTEALRLGQAIGALLHLPCSVEADEIVAEEEEETS